MSGQRWDGDEDGELYGYAAEGCTATEIALLMQRSRNAVIGRANRIGLKIGDGTDPGDRIRAGRAYAALLREMAA